MPTLSSRRAALKLLAGLPFALALPAAAEEKPRGKEAGRGWKSLFDGKSLGDWKKTGFAGTGEVRVDPAFKGGPVIRVDAGESLSGFNWTRDVPKTDYEVSWDVMKLDGSDFMCALTFPVGDSHATLVLGGWGGPVVGISSIDNRDASDNPTTKYMDFYKDRWYHARLRVTPNRLEAWLDDKQIIDQDITGKKISLRPGSISQSVPLGFATYQTAAAYRNIQIRTLKK